MDYKLAEIIYAHIKRVAEKKSAHDARENGHVIEYCRSVHDDAGDDRPKVIYIPEKYVYGAEEHTDAEVYKEKADDGVDEVYKSPVEADTVDGNEHEKHQQ